MPNYTVSLIPISAIVFDGAAPWSLQQGDGQGWAYGSYRFSLDMETAFAVMVADEDGVLQDDPDHPEWGGGNSHVAHSQTLAAPVTTGGKTFAAGTRIEDEYELNVTTPDGTVYRLAAISVQTDPANPYSGSTVIGFTFDGPWPPAGAPLTSVAGSVEDHQVLDDHRAPPCFVQGGMILTARGEVAVETLMIGDLVRTAEGALIPVQWIGHRHITPARLREDPRQRPVRIAAGALGEGMPARDMMVSQQHRMLVRARVAQRMFGETEVLVPAKALIGLPGIELATQTTAITYWHFALKGHHVVLADGAPAESLYVGKMVLDQITGPARNEIFAHYPQLEAYAREAPPPARMLVSVRQGRQLAERLLRNRRPEVEPAPEAPALRSA